MPTVPRAVPPLNTADQPDDFTIKISGLNPNHFAPISPLVTGGKIRVVIDYDKATMQCQMRTEPENALSPAQLVTLLSSLLANLSSIVSLNEQNFQKLQSGLGGAANGRSQT